MVNFKEIQIKILEKALEETIKRTEKESCIYCPYGLKEECNLIDDSKECIEKLKKEAIKEALKTLKIKENCKNKRDRDTLKRAYELACAFLSKITQDNICDYEDYFYQQAKKESEQK